MTRPADPAGRVERGEEERPVSHRSRDGYGDRSRFVATRSGSVETRILELGKRHSGQVRIKGEDGRIQDERTYTRDP